MTIQPYKALYKKDSKGKLRQWRMDFQDVEGNYSHRVVSGLIDGKNAESGWTYTVPKNVGKVNETTARTQAIAEIEAMYAIKRSEDYFDTLEEAKNTVMFSPTLAQDFTKAGKRLKPDGTYYSQPKLDGIRMNPLAKGLFSRSGKPIVSVPHIEKALTRLNRHGPVIYDGELYNHALRSDFNTITSIVRKEKLTKEELATSEKLIQYHIYDAYFPERPNLLFSERYEILNECFHYYGTDDQILQQVDCSVTNNLLMLDVYYENYLKNQYEGQMVRLNTEYEQKRTWSLLKRKEFYTEEFPVVSVTEGLGNWHGMVKQFTLRLPDGREFGAGVRGTQADLQSLLYREKPDWATVRYFEPTPDGIPRFPVVVDYGWGKRND